MKLISLFLISLALGHFQILDFLKIPTQFLHATATHFIASTQSKFSDFYSAILIGKNYEGEKSAFIVLGIYHLIVVSGGHLAFIDKIFKALQFFFKKTITEPLCLGSLTLFTAANRLQPACLRALMARVISNRYGLVKAADQGLVSSILCLSFDFNNWSSTSLHLSVAGALALELVDKQVPALRRRALQSVLCILLMSPLILGFQSCLSWLVVPVNILLLPFLEVTLLPLSFLNVVSQAFRSFGEAFLSWELNFLSGLAEFRNPEVCFSERRFKSWGLVYLIVLFLLSRWSQVFSSRRRFWRTQRSIQCNSSSGMSVKGTL